jgi:hypothetical protein
MASYYVWSGATGAGTGADWANAFTRLDTAFTGRLAGDVFYIADDHNENITWSRTITSPGTAANPCQVLCVRRVGGNVPPTPEDFRTTAVIQTTTANAGGVALAGFAYAYGIEIRMNVQNNSGGTEINFTSLSPWWWRIESGRISVLPPSASTAANRINIGVSNTGQDDAFLELVNTDIRFNNTNCRIAVRARFSWRGGSLILTGTTATRLFIGPGNGCMGGHAELHGVDLSALGSGHALIQPGQDRVDYLFRNCRLGAGVALVSGPPPGPGSGNIRLLNCDSASTNYRFQDESFAGTLTTETVVVRENGAGNGVTPFSRAMVSRSNTSLFWPLISDPITFWNDQEEVPVTVTLHILNNGVTLTNKDVWLEAEYLADANFPRSTFLSGRINPFLAAGVSHPTSLATWDTTGITNPIRQQLSLTFTPQKKGPVRLMVYLARPSTTLFVCPRLEFS